MENRIKHNHRVATLKFFHLCFRERERESSNALYSSWCVEEMHTYLNCNACAVEICSRRQRNWLMGRRTQTLDMYCDSWLCESHMLPIWHASPFLEDQFMIAYSGRTHCNYVSGVLATKVHAGNSSESCRLPTISLISTYPYSMPCLLLLTLLLKWVVLKPIFKSQKTECACWGNCMCCPSTAIGKWSLEYRLYWRGIS